jgi:hypothetical protein
MDCTVQSLRCYCYYPRSIRQLERRTRGKQSGCFDWKESTHSVKGPGHLKHKGNSCLEW